MSLLSTEFKYYETNRFPVWFSDNNMGEFFKDLNFRSIVGIAEFRTKQISGRRVFKTYKQNIMQADAIR